MASETPEMHSQLHGITPPPLIGTKLYSLVTEAHVRTWKVEKLLPESATAGSCTRDCRVACLTL